MRWSPIPPTNTTIVTEFLDKGQNVTFSLFSLFFLTAASKHDQSFISYQEKHYGRDGLVLWYGIYPHQCWYSDRKSPYWEKIPQVPQDVLRTSMTMPNTLPSWLYQFWTLHTTFGPFQHLSGVKNAILPPNALLPEGGLFCIFWIGWKPVQQR